MRENIISCICGFSYNFLVYSQFKLIDNFVKQWSQKQFCIFYRALESNETLFTILVLFEFDIYKYMYI